MRWLGLLALAFYAVHCVYHVRRGHAEDVLWACHFAALVIGIGLLGGWPTWVAVGVTWLVVGVPLWLLDVASGGEFNLTSVLTHVGGLAVGIVGLRQLGMPSQVWWKALLALAALQQVCRWVTPVEANVNVAFNVYPSMKAYFASYWAYLGTMGVLFAGLFFGIEIALRKVMP
jgi:hypothetical protein